MIIPKFKISCSQISKIMANPDNKVLSKTDEKELAVIEKKIAEGKKLTANQEEKHESIKKKIAKGADLPQGAKTYCEEWLKEWLYRKKKEFQSKYTDKGNLAEDDAIEFVVEELELGFAEKNQDRHTHDEWIEGTPDVVLLQKVIDIKNSYDCYSFPLFESNVDRAYWWQGQGYMYLTERGEYMLCYCLMDMPEAMLEKMTRSAMYRDENKFKTYDEVLEEIREKHSYSHIPSSLRLKVFEFERDDVAIRQVIERVKLCREYIRKLITNNEAIRKALEDNPINIAT